MQVNSVSHYLKEGFLYEFAMDSFKDEIPFLEDTIVSSKNGTSPLEETTAYSYKRFFKELLLYVIFEHTQRVNLITLNSCAECDQIFQ